MTVIRPNSVSGINSITANGGDINLFRADGTKADIPIVNNITGVAATFTNISAGSSVTAVTFHGSGANLTNLPAQATIANNADNRIITGGSGVNLNAESNVLYDGTNFGIGKSPSRTLDVQGKIRSSDSVCFGDNSSTPSEGAAIHRPAASTLAFVTNNTERVRIDSSGDLSISDGNLVVASGHGINFSATADPSSGNTSNRQELLDDYEEGQWVPEYSGATAAGSVSYSYRKGYYIKIGAQVTVWIEMTVSSASGMSGATQISNLPFNKNELGGNDATNTGTYYYSGTTNWYIQYHAENKPIFTGWMPDNSNVIRIYNATHWGGVTNAPLNTNGRMSFSYTYTTSA